MRNGIQAVVGATVAALVLAASPALAASARPSDRGRHTLARSGYTHVRITCGRGSCRFTAIRRRLNCAGTLLGLRARRMRIVDVRCHAPHTNAPTRPSSVSAPVADGGGPGAPPAGTPTVTTPSSHAVQFGFNTYITPQTISLEQRLGATVTRMIVPWSTVEATPGQWDWQQSDQEYSELVAAGMRPEIVAFAAPCWARPSMACNDAQYTGPPDPSHDAGWKDFVGRLTARYARALGIEIWNEPNLNMFFWPAPNPARYTLLLKEAYAAVKAVDPTMPVISGGIAGSPATGVVPLGEGDKPFLAGMYAAGAAGSMDAIGAHPYPTEFRADGSQVWDPAAMEQSLDRLRAARDGAADRQTPIWITEVGESTSTQDGFPPGVSATQQALDLSSMIASVRADADVPVMIIHSLQDQSVGTTDAWGGVNAGFGMFTAGGDAKPAGCAVSALLHGSLSC